MTGKILKVGTTSVQRWVKKFVQDFIFKTVPGDAAAVEVGEMWHYLVDPEELR